MAGNQCIYVCADDAYGTATMLLAEREGMTPEELIDRLRVEHEEDFRRFYISHDNYYTTYSKKNERYAQLIDRRLKIKVLTFTSDAE